MAKGAYLDLSVFIDGYAHPIFPTGEWSWNPTIAEMEAQSRQGEDLVVTGNHVTSAVEGEILLKSDELAQLEAFQKGICAGVVVNVNNNTTLAFDDALVKITAAGGLNGSNGGKYAIRIEGTNYKTWKQVA